MNQKINFKLHPDFLLQTIQAQGASFSKALVELIMNSVDAGASKVELTLFKNANSFHFIVQDDGKGFTKKDIMTYFRQFGNPHQNDAYYGAFRIGRGMIFNLAKTKWRSNQHLFLVNIRDALNNKEVKDIGFDLTTVTHEPKVKGCIVSGITYPFGQPYNDENSVEQIVEKLAQICKYLPIQLIINGTIVNQDVQALQADKSVIYFQDQYAHYILSENKNCTQIYNRGVWVQYAKLEQPLLLNACIITKQQLRLTPSRSEVLDDCPVLHHINQQVHVINEELLCSHSFNVTAEIISKFILSKMNGTSNQFPMHILEQLVKLPVLINNTGAHISILNLKDAKNIGFRWDSDCIQTVERIELVHDAIVLQINGAVYKILSEYTAQQSNRTFQQAFVSLVDVFKNLITQWLIGKNMVKCGVIPMSTMVWIDVDVYDKQYEAKYEVLSAAELDTITPDQKQLLAYATLANDCIAAAEYFNSKRNVVLGTTTSQAVAWTDGVEQICLNIHNETFKQNAEWVRLFNVLIHEYCHTSNSLDTAYSGHNEKFYLEFHNACMSANLSKALNQFILKMGSI